MTSRAEALRSRCIWSASITRKHFLLHHLDQARRQVPVSGKVFDAAELRNLVDAGWTYH